MADYLYKDGELKHYGVMGMKWGVRKDRRTGFTSSIPKNKGPNTGGLDNPHRQPPRPNTGGIDNPSRKPPKSAKYSTTKDSAVTRRVKEDYRKMSDKEFMNKYKVSKSRYAKRVKKYGDPYMNSPLAKLGKKLAQKEKQKETKKYISKLEKTLVKDANNDLDKPYRQVIGNGVYANWPTKRAFIEAEINRVKRNGR